MFRTFCHFGELVEFHCRTPSKSTDLNFLLSGKIDKIGKGAHESKAQTAGAYTGFRSMKHA